MGKILYQLSKVTAKNAMLPNLAKTGFIKRWGHFNKLHRLKNNQFANVDGFFKLKESVDPKRYKGIKGFFNKLGANSKITYDKWNGTLQKAVDEWMAGLKKMQSNQQKFD